MKIKNCKYGKQQTSKIIYKGNILWEKKTGKWVFGENVNWYGRLSFEEFKSNTNKEETRMWRINPHKNLISIPHFQFVVGDLVLMYVNMDLAPDNTPDNARDLWTESKMGFVLFYQDDETVRLGVFKGNEDFYWAE